MENYLEKLLDQTRLEANDLNELNEYMSSGDFTQLSREDKDLLYEQCICMNRKVQILGKRLEVRGGTFTHGGDSEL